MIFLLLLLLVLYTNYYVMYESYSNDLLLQGDPGDIGAPGRRGKEGDVVCSGCHYLVELYSSL